LSATDRKAVREPAGYKSTILTLLAHPEAVHPDYVCFHPTERLRVLNLFNKDLRIEAIKDVKKAELILFEEKFNQKILDSKLIGSFFYD
jgi:hypothetical protein